MSTLGYHSCQTMGVSGSSYLAAGFVLYLGKAGWRRAAPPCHGGQPRERLAVRPRVRANAIADGQGGCRAGICLDILPTACLTAASHRPSKGGRSKFLRAQGVSLGGPAKDRRLSRSQILIAALIEPQAGPCEPLWTIMIIANLGVVTVFRRPSAHRQLGPEQWLVKAIRR